MPSWEALVERFGLEPLESEGGLFTQTYLSPEGISQGALPGRYSTDKPFGTAILYLLTSQEDSYSALHQLPTDEIHHFYLGDPVELLLLFPDLLTEHIMLGHDVLNGQEVQHLVPRGVWQGSRLRPGGRFALMGMTMAPGFTSADYRGGNRHELLRQYPQESEFIQRLTRPMDCR